MTRRGLGRGLGALIPGADEGASPGSVSEIEVSRISPNPFQPRREISGPEFDDLVSSVRRHGVIQPVITRQAGSGYELVAGERRWRAAQAAGLASVPAVVRELSDQEMLELALIENLRREDLNPMERAAAYRRLGDEFGMTQEEISDVVGSSRSSIANTIRLLELPNEVQAAIGLPQTPLHPVALHRAPKRTAHSKSNAQPRNHSRTHRRKLRRHHLRPLPIKNTVMDAEKCRRPCLYTRSKSA